MKKYKFGVLGAGNMGTAIAEGAVRAGRFAPEQVLMFNRSEEKRAAHAAKGYAVTGDYTEVYAERARARLLTALLLKRRVRRKTPTKSEILKCVQRRKAATGTSE